MFRSISSSLSLAFQAIAANKFRAFLTSVSIVIGITSVTTMMTVINGMNNFFEDSMSMLGTNVLYVSKMPWDGGPNFKWWEYINRKEIDEESVNKLERLARYQTAIAAVTGFQGNLRRGSKLIERATIVGATSDYSETASLDLSDGRFFNEADDQGLRKVIVIGADIQDQMFEFGQAVGKTIRLSGQKFEVIGVLEKRGEFLGLASLDDQVFVPLNTYRKFYGQLGDLQLEVKYATTELREAGEMELEGVMRVVRGLEPAEESDFAVNKTDFLRDLYEGMTTGIFGVGVFLSGLSLLVGGIGVMNIMYVSVRERTKEIGIRKAVGGKSYHILIQFLSEAVVISCIGGFVGILLSFGTAAAINQIFVAEMSTLSVVISFSICVFVGLTAGFLPALKASKADPISSLRFS